MDVGNLISGSFAFSKSSLNICKFMVNILLKPGLENFEHCFATVWDEWNCVAVWTFFGIAFLLDWSENWPFLALWPLVGFPNLLANWCNTSTAFEVGNQETPGVTGKLGLGMWNEEGQTLIEFCQENALVIANTLFQQHKRRLYTWTSPDGQHRNQPDSCEKKRGEKQKRKGKIKAFECRVPKNSKKR